jgi:hypothetical protein
VSSIHTSWCDHSTQVRLIKQLGQDHQQCQQGRDPAQQQQELLEQHPSAALLMGRQQELHRRPLDPAIAHQVDQVDDDRQRDQRPDDPQGNDSWVKELHGYCRL